MEVGDKLKFEKGRLGTFEKITVLNDSKRCPGIYPLLVQILKAVGTMDLKQIALSTTPKWDTHLIRYVFALSLVVDTKTRVSVTWIG